MTHTKGPWRLQSYGAVGYRIITNDKHTMNLDGVWYPSENEIEAFQANARLVASAPDLLEALETLCTMFESHDMGDLDKDGMIEYTTEAIQKAKQ